MARQGLHQHRKFLGGSALARGILEMLWEPAYDSGDDFLGDAGDISLRCGRPSCLSQSPEQLTEVLLECGFIDELEDEPGQHRIHDLFDHAPDAVAKRAQREAQRLARGKTLSDERAEAGRKGGLARRSSKWKQTKTFASRPEANVASPEANLSTPSPTPTPTPALLPARCAPARKRSAKTSEEPKPPNPRHVALTEALYTAFRETTGSEYAVQGRDWRAISLLAESTQTDAEIVRRWRVALSRSGYHHPTAIWDFQSKLNLYASENGTGPPKKDPSKGYAMPSEWTAEEQAAFERMGGERG